MTKVTFSKKGIFYSELKKKVDQYFTDNRLKKSGNKNLYIKGAILISLSIFIYILLLFFKTPFLIYLVLSLLLGVLLAAVGFNIMHDAIHNCYSSRKWVNDIAQLTLNALGGNAYIYKRKHNLHHSYTNIDGIDDDIAKSPLMRQCYSQKWLPMHRFQHFYIILVYAISGLAWITILDFSKYFTQKINKKEIQKMNMSEHVIFWISKLLYVMFYLIIPMYFLGISKWLAAFICMNVSMGLTLACIFQMAHVVELAEFEMVRDEPKHIDMEWAVHQLRSTANFGTKNKLINWFCGGLNHQVEHHLFPGVSHIHYPAINKILVDQCKESGEPYNAYPTLFSALASHFRLMKKLGEKPGSYKHQSTFI